MQYSLLVVGIDVIDKDLKAEERRRMKESLLAPFAKPLNTAAPKAKVRDMDNKYTDIMGFGTPNIRPWKRMKHMDQAQIKSHLSLQRMVGSMGGGSSGNSGSEWR